MKKIDHIAIATKSLSQSLEFFEKKLGLVCDRIEELHDRGIRVAFLPIGDTRIELIEAMREGSEISSFLEKRGPGLHHIAFESENIQKDFDDLREDGVQFTTETISSGAHDAQVAFVHPKSSQGVLIELTKPTHD
jgi:methylmalonyl-CoA epimerase